MQHLYSAFGLVLGCERELPGLPRLADRERSGRPRPDLILFCQQAPLFEESIPSGEWSVIAASAYRGEGGQPLVVVEAQGRRFRFTYHDDSVFWFEADARKAWMWWPAGSSLEAALLYFFGPVMTLILRHAGRVVLHAAAVSVQGRAMLLAGPGGAGKSTTAAAMVAAGHRLVTDDTAALIRSTSSTGSAGASPILILPDSPRIRLWPDAERALNSKLDSLPLLCADWDKRALDIDTRDFESQPTTVGVVYLLAPPSSRACPSFELLSPARAVPELVARSAAPELTDREMSRRAFELLSDLVLETPVVLLDRGLLTAEALVAPLLEDFRTRSSQAVAVS